MLALFQFPATLFVETSVESHAVPVTLWWNKLFWFQQQDSPTNFSNKCLNRLHMTFAQFEDQPAMAVLLGDAVRKAAPDL